MEEVTKAAKASQGETSNTQESSDTDYVPESPPMYSQLDDENVGDCEVKENEESTSQTVVQEQLHENTNTAAVETFATPSGYSSQDSLGKGNDVIIDIEDYFEEDKIDGDGGGVGGEPSTSAVSGAVVNESELEIGDFSEDEDAMLVSAAMKVEEQENVSKSKEDQGANADLDGNTLLETFLAETVETAPPNLSDDIDTEIDPQIKADDDERRREVDKYLRFQPLDKIYPDVRISEHNTVAFSLKQNYSPGDLLEPYPSKYVSKWESKFVPMPFCDENFAIVRIPKPATSSSSGTENQRSPPKRIPLWPRIRLALESYSIMALEDFESSLKRYCKLPGELKALSYCLENIMSPDEKSSFFSVVIPFMTSLVLQTSDIITCPLPFLRRNVNHNISLSQKQVGCLLANAFFCTFPRRFQSEPDMPSINFKDLFCEGDERVMKVKAEKIRCLINYFARIEAEMPTGVVTYSRKNLRHSLMPSWEKIDKGLTKLTPLIQGTIEDDGEGMLKVDFANSFIGGGALGKGAVQEEILFMIYPELILSRLFSEKLNSNEAIIITGCERFSSYRGYSYSFKYAGDYHDCTPLDSKGRRCTQIVAIDALYISRPTFQFHPKHFRREINKAYVGFSSPVSRPVAIATGKWGCGAFNGDPHLKAVIQLIAASHAGRDIAFYTFGDVQCLNDILSIYGSISHMKIKDVWNLLCQYHSLCCSSSKTSRSLKDFCRQYSDGQVWQMQQSEAEKAAAAAEASTSKKIKEVPITRFYHPSDKRHSSTLDDESVVALINGIHKINSPAKKTDPEKKPIVVQIPIGKRLREDELSEDEIRQQLLYDNDEENGNGKDNHVPKPNPRPTINELEFKDETRPRSRAESRSGGESENVISPKSSKRPKRAGLPDFYSDPTATE